MSRHRLVSIAARAADYAGEGHLVYFLGAPAVGMVKIGYTFTFYRRVKKIQAMSPVPLEILGVMYHARQSTEAWIHRRFAHLRTHGEWFVLDDELRHFIAEKATTLLEPEPVDMRKVAERLAAGSILAEYIKI